MKGTLLRMVVVVCVVTSTAGVATAGGVQAVTGAAAEPGAASTAAVDAATAGSGDRSAQVGAGIDVE